MQDPKNNLYIFNFSPLNKKFIKWTVLFLVPVVLVIIILELLVLELPTNYKKNSSFFNQEKNSIKIMALGSSQMESAINPEKFSDKTICMASKSQHHDLDFPILKQLAPKMSELQIVVFELSYSHLEIPHNGNSFWKNSVYLKYYGVNAFERNTYFKDRLIYISSPDIYSRLLIDHYIHGKKSGFNKFGVDTIAKTSLFSRLKYNSNAIDKVPFKIRTEELPQVFKLNSEYFKNMIDDATTRGLKIVIVTIPLHANYLKARNANILKRRDSILSMIEDSYANVRVFRKEEDTINFTVEHFRNHNHLNLKGANKFSELLNNFINQSYPDK